MSSLVWECMRSTTKHRARQCVLSSVVGTQSCRVVEKSHALSQGQEVGFPGLPVEARVELALEELGMGKEDLTGETMKENGENARKQP